MQLTTHHKSCVYKKKHKTENLYDKQKTKTMNISTTRAVKKHVFSLLQNPCNGRKLDSHGGQYSGTMYHGNSIPGGYLRVFIHSENP